MYGIMENGKKRETSGNGGDISSSSGSGGRATNEYFVDKKKKRNCDEEIERRPARILTRRYCLTKTGYKYLDIGIKVTTPSHVNIAIGDSYGREISLTPQMWTTLVEAKRIVLSNLRNGIVDASPIAVESVTARFGKINNLPILRLESSNVRLAMSLGTVTNMYELEHCANQIVSSLSAITTTVDAKLRAFNNIAAGVPLDRIAAHEAIRGSELYNRRDIIDCELLALCFATT